MFRIIDPRDRKLARTLIHYSVEADRGDLVFIHCVGNDTLSLGAACAEEATRCGAAPHIEYMEPEIHRRYLLQADEDSMRRLAQFELAQMNDATCYIGLRGQDNIFETADVSKEKQDLYNKLIVKPVHLEARVKTTRWCVLRYPTSSMAQQAQMSREGFADFYYSECCVDYARMGEAVRPLKALMDKTNWVRIVGPTTNLRFSIRDNVSIPCCGMRNIPDGECFTAPVRDSMNGSVVFNAPTVQEGSGFEQIKLRFVHGQVVQAEAANEKQTRKLNEILDRDEGSRYVGEWSLGFNPRILEPMRDTLFDEKIAGSFHMALGQCYEEAPNGNESALHWDLVSMQRPENGGGEIYFDNALVRKDGLFVLDELQGLNPDALGGSGAEESQ